MPGALYGERMNTAPDTKRDDDRAQVIALAHAVYAMRDALNRLESMRDAAVRRYDRSGRINRAALARDMGMSRSRFYDIVDPEIQLAPDGELDFVDFEAIERADALWEAAIDRWEAADREGDVDDYFPLDQATR